jgi:hypothetical protein
MKATKVEAAYKDKTATGKRCDGCKSFQKSNSCSLVQGIIKPNGTCKYYRAKGAA